MAVTIKEEYLKVNADSLVKICDKIREGFSTQKTYELQNDADALAWEGSDAKDNVQEAVSKIYLDNLSLSDSLSVVRDAGNKISKYQKNVKKYRTLKKQATTYKKNMDEAKKNNNTLLENYNYNLLTHAKDEIEKLEVKIKAGNKAIKAIVGI
ncbi:MAG: hypothetical protein ACI4U4_02810 [Bacilli bacterium]